MAARGKPLTEQQYRLIKKLADVATFTNEEVGAMANVSVTTARYIRYSENLEDYRAIRRSHQSKPVEVEREEMVGLYLIPDESDKGEQQEKLVEEKQQLLDMVSCLSADVHLINLRLEHITKMLYNLAKIWDVETVSGK